MTAPGGALPGLWPAAPDAPVLVPVPSPIRTSGEHTPVFVLDHDTVYFATSRSGALVTSRKPERNVRFSLAAVSFVLAGTIGGLRKRVGMWAGPRDSREYVTEVEIANGPAVWIGFRSLYLLVPTPDPQTLAAEIERRRHRVARYGSSRAAKVWSAVPQLRAQGPDGPVPGTLPDAPAVPPIVAGSRGTWTPLPVAAPSSISPAGAVEPAEPLAGVAGPETLDDFYLGLPSPVVNVSCHRVKLSQAPLPSVPPFQDPDTDQDRGRPYLTVPLAEFCVIRTGVLTGMPPGWAHRVIASDTHTEIRMDIVDGPAVWLWGMSTEWLLCTPHAQRLAADLRERRRTGMLYPIVGRLSPEYLTWQDHPDTDLVETDQGWCLPPTPPYTPPAPTIVPNGTWQST